ncbi:MAG: IscS subfamily cysteine desulfurase [Candidatus Dadabacteria bacterium]
MHLPVYLDYNATTPCDDRVVEAMLPFFREKFGNAASRSHIYGWEAEEAVEIAREQVSALVGSETKEIVFTSGATEAVNLALKGVFESYAGKGNHIITTNIEHKAVLDTCKHLESLGAEITYLPVNSEGLITVQQVIDAIRPTTIAVSVMYANNEIGTIMPLAEIGKITREKEVLFFSDATQAVGKIPVNVNALNLDIMSLSAHKFYGPKGVGALFVRRRSPRVRLKAQIDGGGHERGFRSGTLNVTGIVGLGKAAEIAAKELTSTASNLAILRNKLESSLMQLGDVTVNGSREQRLPHVTNLSFKHVEGQALMMGFNKQIALSSGSACTSASLEPSYVLKALGLENELAYSSLRFSLGKYTTAEEIDYVIEQVSKTVVKLREISPVWQMYKEGKGVNG